MTRFSRSGLATWVLVRTACVRASSEGERARAKAEVDDDIVLSGSSCVVGVREGQWSAHKS